MRGRPANNSVLFLLNILSFPVLSALTLRFSFLCVCMSVKLHVLPASLLPSSLLSVLRRALQTNREIKGVSAHARFPLRGPCE